MSNMNLKDWRERAVKLGKRERRQKDRRDRIELIMAGATVLSAISTVAAVAVGYFQYDTALQALTAADVNRSREAYISGWGALCAEYRHQKPTLEDDYADNGELKRIVIISDELPLVSSSDLNRRHERIKEKVEEVGDLYIKLLIWEDADAFDRLEPAMRREINAIRNMTTNLSEDDRFWTEIIEGSFYCQRAYAKLIFWVKNVGLDPRFGNDMPPDVLVMTRKEWQERIKPATKLGKSPARIK